MELILLEETDSTNLYAKRNFYKFSDKTVISAAAQTCGRGRFNRAWIDLGGENLFLTIILKPSEAFIDCYANLTQYMSLILCKVLDEYGLEPSIKWPNDVLINGKKVAGILCETVMDKNVFKGLVLGVGVNLNSECKTLKKIKDKQATAVNIELKKKHIDKKFFTDMLLNEFFAGYENFLRQGFAYIENDYIKRCYFLGKKISVHTIDKNLDVTAKSINSAGELVYEYNGNRFILTAGDID